MANVLVVTTLQLSDPMLLAVLVKADDSLLHEPQSMSDALGRTLGDEACAHQCLERLKQGRGKL